jgi:hypothetical protein
MENEELRKAWRNAIEHDGAHCPVCDRWGKIYPRSINISMAKSLIWLCSAKADESGWVNVPVDGPQWVVRTNQLSTLRWWGLVERRPNTDDDKRKHSGFWKATQIGLDFVTKNTRVPKKVFTYNGYVEGTSLETVAIEDCFKEMFDYQDVMKTYFKKGN